MWAIAVLLVISFALMLFGRIAKTRRPFWLFLWPAMAIWGVAAYLTPINDYAPFAIMDFLFISLLTSELIAIPILRRRVIPPRVRVRVCLSGFYNFFKSFFVIAIVIFLILTKRFHSLQGMLAIGPLAFIIIIFVLRLFEKTEICRNGLWQYGKLEPWEEYESFSWGRSTDDSVELRLVSKSWTVGLRRLMVPIEDREAVHQLLDENLPNLSPIKMNSCSS